MIWMCDLVEFALEAVWLPILTYLEHHGADILYSKGSCNYHNTETDG